MANKAMTLEEATTKIEEAINDMDIVIDIPWHRFAIAAGVAAGIGALTYAIFSKIESIRLQKEFEKMNLDISYEEHDPIGDTGDTDDHETVFGSDTDGDAVIRLPYGLEKNPQFINEKDEKDGEHTGIINPSIEIKDSFDEFGSRLDGYLQEICTYFRLSDIVASFDESEEEFNEQTCEAIKQAMEYLDDHPGREVVYAVDHNTETVFEVTVDDEHTYEEVIDDARI